MKFQWVLLISLISGSTISLGAKYYGGYHHVEHGEVTIPAATELSFRNYNFIWGVHAAPKLSSGQYNICYGAGSCPTLTTENCTVNFGGTVEATMTSDIYLDMMKALNNIIQNCPPNPDRIKFRDDIEDAWATSTLVAYDENLQNNRRKI